jgi:hypothetical protein
MTGSGGGRRRAGARVALSVAFALSLATDGTAQQGAAATSTLRGAPGGGIGLREVLSDTDMRRVFDRLTRLDLSGGSDIVHAARCVASGDCSTRYTPVADSVAPAALARAITRDAALRHRVQEEAEGLLDGFRKPRRQSHVDVVDAVTFLLVSATTAYARAPQPAEQVAFRRSLQRALSRNGAFQLTSNGERQMAAELCEILGMHLLRESANHASAPRPQVEAVRRYAEQVIHAAFKVRLTELEWSRFAADEER